MRRKDLSVWVALLMALALVAVLATGCGDEGTSASPDESSAPPAVELTGQEIVDQSTEAMSGLTSASFTADLKLDLEGDASKMTDPAARNCRRRSRPRGAALQSRGPPEWTFVARRGKPAMTVLKGQEGWFQERLVAVEEKQG